jgi:hypothetical protein
MRIAPKTFIALLLGVLILPTGVLAPAQAATPTRMTAFTMTPAVSSPTGLGTTTVTVSTHLIDPDGIAAVPAFHDDIVVGQCPCLAVVQAPINRAVPQPGLYIVPLTLTAGTVTDGTWTGRFILGSGQSGHWRTRILAGDFGQSVALPNQPFAFSSFAALPSPFTEIGVDIRGTNRPVIGLLSVVRQANGRFLVKGNAYRASGRTPIRNTRFEVTGSCDLSIVHAIIGVRTNSVGVYAVSLTRAQLGGAGGQICVAQVAYPGQWRLTESLIRPVP